MSRVRNIHTVTKRLILMTAAAVAAVTIIFGVSLLLGQRLMLTQLAFSCGIVGGFVSIQQRLKTVSDEELELLARSWFQLVLVPIFGGVFALVLYCVFLSGIVSGQLFPAFAMPAPPASGPDTRFVIDLMVKTYPATGPDLAKFLFWSFAGGFSERLVPQIVTKMSARAGEEEKEEER
jgi:hypothetical protein